MALNEQLIAKHMATLGISRDEAIQLIEDDRAVDRMTSQKEIEGDGFPQSQVRAIRWTGGL